ncbi:ATP-binding protein (plasmid) [Nostoc sp. UHCC 0926]|uniref:ATP-binding protein n=1 Tax=Nostoc sp. UHCC 0926 TaxID=3025190 RepID=UPI0023605B88|nr:ATP-binding protein [Nostoc sp. UHCC 0926]WDD36082.1 ATP-binding protein [Nostoc sp. UHCC 0926]
MLATGAIVAVNGLNPLSLLTLGIGGVLAMSSDKLLRIYAPNLTSKLSSKNETQELTTEIIPTPGEKCLAGVPPVVATSGEFRIYRQAELNRTTASLLANGAILIAGEDGSGKSVLAVAVVEKLQADGFMVAFIEPATPKQMLLEIAHQFDIPTEDLEGKSLTADKLKRTIAGFLEENTAFLVLDDAHCCDAKFRMWLKQLCKSGVPMLLLATDPPRKDVFINIPRIELKPLPEQAIREIMIQAAAERAIALKPSELSKLQERASGNPMLAARAVDEEYLGLDVESGDHRRYFDITPLILLIGIGFVIVRLIGRGTNDQALYIFGGIAAAVFMGLSRILYNLPRENQRIQ